MTPAAHGWRSIVDRAARIVAARVLRQSSVTGGASIIPELPLYLANKFGINVEIGNAWRNVVFAADRQDELLKISNQFSVAVGLAERNE